VLAGNASNRLQSFFTTTGQMQSVDAPVCRAGASFDQSGLFQLVEHQHQPARKHAQKIGQHLLTNPVVPVDHAKNASLGRSKLQRRQ
jgi:hypothetical protein